MPSSPPLAAPRVGVELELGGIELDPLLLLLRDHAGGTLQTDGPYAARLLASRLGNLRVELDAKLFRELKLRAFLDRLGLEHLDPSLPHSLEAFMASEARRLVPHEIVFDPLPPTRLPELDALCAALRPHTEGTGASVLNAYGLHFNPELPSPDAPRILLFLRAFLCLADELKAAHRIDLTRSIAPFISPFPRAYTLLVLAPDYTPDLPTLIDDYLDANPTRNRPLDLLPLFAHLDPERLTTRLPQEKISARPTFHYRLPDCRIDEPDWSLSAQWQIWTRVEKLASSPSSLASACHTRLDQLRGPLDHLSTWLSPS